MFVFLEHRSSTTVTVFLSSCSPYRSCLLTGFSWCSPTSHPDLKKAAAFRTQHNPTQPNPTKHSPTQPNKTQHNPTQHNPNPITTTATISQPGQLLLSSGLWHLVPGAGSSLSAVPGGAGNASPSPFSASAHKAAGVGCLLFSLQPGM